MRKHPCLPEFESCPCTTCAKDPTNSSAECCLAHNIHCSDDDAVCPDYLKEENADATD